MKTTQLALERSANGQSYQMECHTPAPWILTIDATQQRHTSYAHQLGHSGHFADLHPPHFECPIGGGGLQKVGL